MKITRSLIALSASVLAASPAVAQAQAQEHKPSVHDLQPAHIPLLMAPLDTAQPSAPIWFKGDAPQNRQLAKVSFRPLDAVAIDLGAPGAGAGPLVLWRAIVGRAARFATLSEIREAKDGRTYCARPDALKNMFLCFVDADENGSFEGIARGTGERAPGLARLTIVGPPEALPKPLPYRAARPDEIEAIPASFVNCAKDHDRPRYAVQLPRPKPSEAQIAAIADQLTGLDRPAAMAAARRLADRSQGFAPCQESEPVEATGALAAALRPDAFAVRMDELLVEVGTKDAGAPSRLLGLRDADRLYRLDGAGVAPLSDTLTDAERELAIRQKFDKPVLMTAAGAQVNAGVRGAGDVIATLPVAHGYMGVLTADTTIRTILSSRSVPAGTVVYGVPMSSRLTMTRNGIPMGPWETPKPTVDNFDLVWCLPVEDEGRWSATCLPIGGAGYTILKGQQPAFQVSGLSYSAETSTNDGRPPVKAQPGSFGKPLVLRLRLKSVTATQLVIAQETVFGDALVSTRDRIVPRVAGKASGLIIGGGVIGLSPAAGASDRIEVAAVKPIEPGEDAARVEAGLLRENFAAPAEDIGEGETPPQG
jgi:hypothetical protein